MHSLGTINQLEQRRADNAEAQRILRANGYPDTKVLGADNNVETGFIGASVEVHDAIESGTQSD